MIAVTNDRFGRAYDVLRLEDLPTPTTGPGEVLLRLRASDVKVRDGVNRGRVGERAWIRNGQWRRAFGTAA